MSSSVSFPTTAPTTAVATTSASIAAPAAAASPSGVEKIQNLLNYTLSFLLEEEIIVAHRVSKQWKAVASSNVVWKPICDREGIPPIKRPGKDPKGNPTELCFYKEAYQKLYPIIFGPKQYSKYLCSKPIGNIVPIRRDIHDLLAGLDATYTYRLIYLSKDIESTNADGHSSISQITMKRLGELMQGRGVRNQANYGFVWPEILSRYGETPLEHSNWVLLSTGLVEETRYASYPDQVATVSALGNNARAPKFIEAIALNFFNYARFGIYLLGQKPWVYSRTEGTEMDQKAQRYPIVGSFSSSGLHLAYRSAPDRVVGMVAAYSCAEVPKVTGN
jgi:hypothetical protein